MGVLFKRRIESSLVWSGERVTRVGVSKPSLNAPTIDTDTDTDTDTDAPRAGVTCWAARTLLLGLGQTTSGVREQTQSSCLLGEENIPLSPIPPSPRLNGTFASHLLPAQQVFRP